MPTPEMHTFEVQIEALHNWVPMAVDMTDTDGNWFRIRLNEDGPVRFEIII